MNHPGHYARSALLWIIGMAGLLAGVLSVAQTTFPAQITDEAFWKLMTDASEPGGDFQDENYVSNELRYQDVLPGMQQSIKRGGVYVGVGPEQNFTYISALQPSLSFIIDIRRQNAMELLLYKSLFELSSDRADFLSRLFCRARPAKLSTMSTANELFAAYDRVPADAPSFQRNLSAVLKVLTQHRFPFQPGDEASITKVYRAFCDSGTAINYVFKNSPGRNPSYTALMTATDAQGKNWSYLATEENFRRVQDLEARNLIVPIVGDFAGPRALRAVGDYVRAHQGVIDVFYVSNVEQYLFEGGTWKTFYESLATLPINKSSTFVRTVAPGGWRACGPLRPNTPMMQPLRSNIADFNRAYKNGQIKTQCDMLDRAR